MGDSASAGVGTGRGLEWDAVDPHSLGMAGSPGVDGSGVGRGVGVPAVHQWAATSGRGGERDGRAVRAQKATRPKKPNTGPGRNCVRRGGPVRGGGGRPGQQSAVRRRGWPRGRAQCHRGGGCGGRWDYAFGVHPCVILSRRWGRGCCTVEAAPADPLELVEAPAETGADHDRCDSGIGIDPRSDHARLGEVDARVAPRTRLQAVDDRPGRWDRPTLATGSPGWPDSTRPDTDRPGSRRGTLLLVDEAGMVGTPRYGDFGRRPRARGAKTVLVGDAHPVAPGGSRGGMFAELVATCRGAASVGGVADGRSRDGTPRWASATVTVRSWPGRWRAEYRDAGRLHTAIRHDGRRVGLDRRPRRRGGQPC